MAKEKRQKVILSIRIDPVVLRKIDDLAERTGVGRAEIVDRCIRVGLKEDEEFVRDLERPIIGEMIHALTNPKVITMLAKIFDPGVEVDPIQMKRRDAAAIRRRGKGPAGNAATA